MYGSSNSGRIGMARQKARFVDDGGYERGFKKGGNGNSKRAVDQHKQARQDGNRQKQDTDYGDSGY